MDVLEKRKQFGTRYLINESETFDYNAWDNVEWSEEQLQEAMSKIAEQKKFMVDVEKAGTLVDNPRIQWENFYGKHGGKFFMNRNWILTEFPELNTQNSVNVVLILIFYFSVRKHLYFELCFVFLVGCKNCTK